MVNWKTYKIESAGLVPGGVKIMFGLGWIYEVHVDYKDKRDEGCMNTYVVCANTYPFNTWKEGDYIEVDNDKTQYKSCHEVLNDASVVRKISSSAVASSSSSNQQITSNQIQARDERMRRWVEESGGEYEADFIARQEYRGDGSISANELKWTYRKK